MKFKKIFKKNKFDNKTKSKCLIFCLATFLFCSAYALLNTHILLAIFGFTSLVLFVLTYKKKTIEQIKIEAEYKALNNLINKQGDSNA